jgi:hypothetical protein
MGGGGARTRNINKYNRFLKAREEEEEEGKKWFTKECAVWCN